MDAKLFNFFDRSWSIKNRKITTQTFSEEDFDTQYYFCRIEVEDLDDNMIEADYTLETTSKKDLEAITKKFLQEYFSDEEIISFYD